MILIVNTYLLRYIIKKGKFDRNYQIVYKYQSADIQIIM